MALKLLTIPQAADRLGVGRSTVDREIAAGRLAVVRIRGSRRITPQDLDDYIARSRQYVAPIDCAVANVVLIDTPGLRAPGNALDALLDRERQQRQRARLEKQRLRRKRGAP